jgi:hypothetical protein
MSRAYVIAALQALVLAVVTIAALLAMSGDMVVNLRGGTYLRRRIPPRRHALTRVHNHYSKRWLRTAC